MQPELDGFYLAAYAGRMDRSEEGLVSIAEYMDGQWSLAEKDLPENGVLEYWMELPDPPARQG